MQHCLREWFHGCFPPVIQQHGYRSMWQLLQLPRSSSATQPWQGEAAVQFAVGLTVRTWQSQHWTASQVLLVCISPMGPIKSWLHPQKAYHPPCPNPTITLMSHNHTIPHLAPLLPSSPLLLLQPPGLPLLVTKVTCGR
jgi:hypothetical protein